MHFIKYNVFFLGNLGYDCDKATVYVYSGSNALNYAKNNDLNYKSISSSIVNVITLNKSSAKVNEGSTVSLTASTTHIKGSASSTITWTSSNTSVATVNSSGVVTGKAAGTATITAKSGNAISATCKVTVSHVSKSVSKKAATTSANGYTAGTVCSICGETLSDKKTIYKVSSISLSSTSYTYDGNAKKPTVTIKDSKGNKLTSGTDYSVSYSNNKNVGTGKATITFKDNYSGTVTKTFKINAKSISKFTATLSTTTYTYNGKQKTPSVTLKNGSKTLTKGTDYTVTYASGRKNVGTYTVTIKGKGNYTGTITKTFKIKPATTSIKSLTKAKKAFTVKWTKKTTQVTGYQIQYSTSSKFSSAKTVTISKNSTTSKKISSLKSKTKYYVRIRTYKTVNGTKYYSSWSSSKSVTTK